jgi:hypothetical protein
MTNEHVLHLMTEHVDAAGDDDVLVRSTMVTYRSASTTATSPVRNQRPERLPVVSSGVSR